MEDTETSSDQAETLRDIHRMVSEVHAVVVKHLPLLDAFTGAGVRGFLTGKGRRAVQENGTRQVPQP
jgi:hypothetical protein